MTVKMSIEEALLRNIEVDEYKRRYNSSIANTDSVFVNTYIHTHAFSVFCSLLENQNKSPTNHENPYNDDVYIPSICLGAPINFIDSTISPNEVCYLLELLHNRPKTISLLEKDISAHLTSHFNSSFNKHFPEFNEVEAYIVSDLYENKLKAKAIRLSIVFSLLKIEY